MNYYDVLEGDHLEENYDIVYPPVFPGQLVASWEVVHSLKRLRQPSPSSRIQRATVFLIFNKSFQFSVLVKITRVAKF